MQVCARMMNIKIESNSRAAVMIDDGKNSNNNYNNNNNNNLSFGNEKNKPPVVLNFLQRIKPQLSLLR